MSNVDERIVEMKFENHLFEKNVNTSIGTLEKLKNALKFNGVDKNLADLDKSVNSMDFSKLAAGVDALNKRFSTMGIVGMTVIQDLTRAAENMAHKMATGLFNQIKTGGWARATNIDQAKFQLEGLGVAWNDIVADIEYGVNDTAYGLDSAAKVASQLVASGITIGDNMQAALRGVSGVAAMTNSSYDEIGAIFTTVAGQGKLMTMQLRQLESRGLNVAANLGKASGKLAGKTESEIRDMVTKGQIDFQTFADAMNEVFGPQAKKANETFEGSLANMKSALSRIGAEFATPIRKNMIPIFNKLREIFNDIKKQKLGQVFKDFESFAFKMSKFAYGVLDTLHKNLGFVDTLAGGIHSIWIWFDELMQGVSPVWKFFTKAEEKAEVAASAISKVGLTLEVVEDLAQRVLAGEFGNEQARWDAIDELTGIENAGLAVQNRVNELLNCSKRYSEAAEIVEDSTTKEQEALEKAGKSIEDYAEAQNEIQDTAQGMIETLQKAFGEIDKAAVFEWAATVIGGFRAALTILGRTVMAVAAGALEPLIEIGKTIAGVFGKVTSTIAEWVMDFSKFMKESGGYAKIQTVTNKVFKAFSSILKGTVKVGSKVFDILGNAIGKVGSIIDQAKFRFQVFMELLKNTEGYKRLTEAFGNIGSKLIELKDNAFSKIQDALNRFMETDIELPKINLMDLANSVSDGIVWMLDKINELKTSILDFYNTNIVGEGGLMEKLQNFFSSENLQAGIQNFIELINEAREAIVKFFTGTSGAEGEAEETTSGLQKFLDDVNRIFEQIKQTVVDLVNNGIEDFNDFVNRIKESIPSLDEVVKKIMHIVGEITAINFIRAVNGIMTSISHISGILRNVKGAIGSFKWFFRSLSLAVSGLALLEIAGAIGILALSFKLLGSLSWDQFKVAAAAIIVITSALAVLFAVIGHFSSGKGGKIVETPLQSLTEMVKTLSSTISKAMKGLGRAATIAAFAYAVKTIYDIIMSVVDMPWYKVKTGLKLVGAIMAEIVIAMAALNLLGGHKSTGMQRIGQAAQIVAFAAAIKLIANAIAQIAELDASKAEQGIKAIKTISLSLSALMISSRVSKLSLKPIIGLGLLFAAIAYAFGQMAGMDPDEMKATAGALTSIIATLSLLVYSLGKMFKNSGTGNIKSTVVSFIALGALIGEMALIFSLMQDMDPLKMASQADAMAKVLRSLAFVMWATSKIGSTGSIGGDVKGAVGSALSADIILANVTGIMAIAGLINENAPWLKDLIDSGIPLLNKVAEGIGDFIGTLLKHAIINPLEDTVGDLGDGLMGFIDGIKQFMEGTKDLDVSGVSTISDLLSVFSSLAGAGILTAITDFFMGESSMENFGTQMVAFGNALVEYSGIVAGNISEEAVASSARAAQMLSDFANTLPNEGGWLGAIVGENNLSDFANQLVGFGTELVKYSAIITSGNGIDEAAVTASARAATMIAEFANKIPNQGGALGALVGDNTLAQFAAGLEPFATAMVTYSDIIKNGNIDSAAVENSANAATMISKFASTIPNQGGKIAKWVGDNTLSQFAGELVPFATELVKYSAIITSGKGIDSDAVEASAAAGSILASFADAIPNSGGYLAAWIGDNTLSQFGATLVPFAEDLKSYSEACAGLDMTDAIAATGAISDLVALFNQINAEGGLLGAEQTGAKLSEIEDIVSSLFTNFAWALEDVDDVTSVSDAISNLGKKMGETMSKGLAEGIKSTEGGTDLQNAFSEMIQKMINGADGQAGDLSGLAESIVASLGTIGDAITTSLGADNLSATIVPELTAALTEMFATINSKQPIFRTAGSNLVNALAGGVRQGRSWVTAALQAIGIAGFNAINAYQSRFRTAGRNMGAGLAGGLRQSRSEVVSAARSLADAANAELKHRTKQNSPSKLWGEFGDNMGQGLANGLIGSVGVVKSAVGVMAKGTHDTMTGELNSSVESVTDNLYNQLVAVYQYINSVINESTNINPVITPVVDLSQVQNGMYSAGAMLSSAGNAFGAGALSYARSNFPGSYSYGATSQAMNQGNNLMALNGIRSDIKELSETMSTMQMVLDSGVLVGQLGSGMDRRLGTIQKLKERGA